MRLLLLFFSQLFISSRTKSQSRDFMQAEKILPFLNITKSSASTTTNRSTPWGGLLRTTIMPDFC